MSGGNGRMLGTAIVFILVTIVWTLAHMVPFFLAMRFLGLLRVPQVCFPRSCSYSVRCARPAPAD